MSIKKLIIIIFSILLYLFLINSLFNFMDNVDYSVSNFYDGNISGSVLNIGISDNLGAQVVRERWYGKVVSFHSKKQKPKTLIYLFYFIKLPVYNDFNFVYLHIIFTILVLFLLVWE